MTIVDLKRNIANKLAQIDDAEFLSAIEVMISNKTSGEIYVLNDMEKNRIESAREQVRTGKTISHTKVKNEINKWLNSK